MTNREKEQRAKAYAIYRDMGKTRSYERLQVAIEKSIGWLPKRRITVWGKEERWQERVAEWDREHSPEPVQTNPGFDRPEALLRTAHKALQHALASTPVVRTPQDYKAMIDASEKAIRLVEKLRELGVDNKSDKTVEAAGERWRRLFAFAEKKMLEKFRAAGTPVLSLEEQVALREGRAALPAPTENPITEAEFEEVPIEPVMVEKDQTAVEKPVQTESVVEAHGKEKELSVAERLAKLHR